MKNWSLKVKVGAYAALLTMIALGVTASVIMPLIYYRQIEQLDSVLANDAEELYRDLKNFREAPVDPRRPIEARLIPVALLSRYLLVTGPEGQILYRSPSMPDSTLGTVNGTVKILGENCRVGTYQKGPYGIQIGTRLDAIEGFQRDLRRGFLMSLPLVGLVVFGGGIWLGRRAVAPVAGLTEAAERISTARPHERLPLPVAKDEIARLTEVLNASFDRMQGSYDAARRFSADASHQLKTPVSVLRVGLGELRDCGYLKEEESAEVQSLLQQTRRLSALIEDLLLLAQVDAGRLKLEAKEVDLVPLIASARDDLETLTEGHGVSVSSEEPMTLIALGDRRRVALVLQNMVENAAKYTPEGGRVLIRAGHENGMAWVRVGNSGKEIPLGDQDSLFERFYRGSAVGESVRGQGLGLNIARELARAHGGELVLVGSAQGWTEFELRLPGS